MNKAMIGTLLLLLAMSQAARSNALDEIIESCDDCHGENGVSQWDDVPTIAGIDAFVHSDALFVYRDDGRPCAMSAYRRGDTSRPETSMCEAVAELDDDTIEAIGDHYAALEFVPASQEFDAALAEAGKAVHDSACAKCHSDGGSNPEDEASILAGQWMGYLRTTFAEYASGEREQMKKMKEKMDALSDEEADALLHYYASQQ